MRQSAHRDTNLRTVQLVSEMIEYRNGEIDELTRDLKLGISRLHREQVHQKHFDQLKELTETLRRISLHISDNNFDIDHLQIFLTPSPEKVMCPSEPEKIEQVQDVHYIQ